MKHKDEQPVPARAFAALPVITVQLPVFNEMYVVDRLIDSVCQLDYPRDLLEIQVLDDSTDETREIAELAVRRHAAQGIDIKYLHRTDRTGYKAGALDEGLKVARGQFVAIFDADFMPKSDFLMRMVHYFTDPKVAMVQARWGHINQDYSLLTKIQSILLDAHFVLEHGCAQPRRLLLQLQRHRRHVAPRGHRRRRRLAARHADRRPRSQLPHAAARLAVRVPAGPCRSGRTAGRDERVQVAAAPLGEGLHPDLPQADAAHPAVEPADQGEGRSLLPPVGELQLPADVRAVRADVAVDDHPLQHGLVRDAAHRHPAVLRGDGVGGQLLHGLRSARSTRTPGPTA